MLEMHALLFVCLGLSTSNTFILPLGAEKRNWETNKFTTLYNSSQTILSIGKCLCKQNISKLTPLDKFASSWLSYYHCSTYWSLWVNIFNSYWNF